MNLQIKGVHPEQVFIPLQYVKCIDKVNRAYMKVTSI